MMKMLKLPVLAIIALMFGQLSWAAGGEEDASVPVLEPIEEVQEVIESQLLAFQSSDGPGAFFHAAPGIQSALGDPEQFMMMVERGYNVIYQNTDWVFEDFNIQGIRAAQIVRVNDASGRELRAVYYLVQMNGRWRIEGVQRIEGSSA